MWLKHTLGNLALLQNGTKEEHGTIFWFVLFIKKLLMKHMQQKRYIQLNVHIAQQPINLN